MILVNIAVAAAWTAVIATAVGVAAIACAIFAARDRKETDMGTRKIPVGPRHDCSEFGWHVHLNGYTRCSRCNHYYDAVHVPNELCVWCMKDENNDC